jgi:low affinity Fe/Cu permease
MSFSESFSRLAKWTAHASGRPATFAVAVVVILVWAASGPIFHYSDTWQLVINTGTTVVTFLMVFLIQNTQNRDATAMQIKLDELVRAVHGAHNAVVSMEDAEEQELVATKARYDALAARARARAGSGEGDTDSPELIAEVAEARSDAIEAKGKAAHAVREAKTAQEEAKRKQD